MIERIENIEKLAAALGGEFYDFHDAEIVSIKYDRGDKIMLGLVLQIHRRIDDFESDGKIFERFKNFDAKFEFSDVWLLHMHGFGHQNVIQELIVTEDEKRFIVHFKEIYGCDLKFECETMKLSGIEIFETEKEKNVSYIDKMSAAALAARNRDTKKH